MMVMCQWCLTRSDFKDWQGVLDTSFRTKDAYCCPLCSAVQLVDTKTGETLNAHPDSLIFQRKT